MGKWPILDKIEMIDGPIDEKTYEHDLEKLQHRLLDLQTYHMRTGGRVIIGIDGWDAAGKGGLIERIEGLCSVDAWKRAYREINEFERELTDDGVRIVKILVHISAEEQKRRMIDRLNKPHKHYKIGLEDFRNIAKRKEYLEAYDDMLERTDTDDAPWHVVASDNKLHARLTGLRIVADEIGKGVEITQPPLDPKIVEAAFKLWGWKPDNGKNDKKNGKKK